MEEIAVNGFDHIEFYVGNALQACYYYHHGFGFDVVGYRGLETGCRDSVSYVLRQNRIQIVLTGALSQDHLVTSHVSKHGDGVSAIGLRVQDCRKAYEIAISRGAESVRAPLVTQDNNGTYIHAEIKTYGDTIHRFVERHNYGAHFAPGFRQIKASGAGLPLHYVDHVVGNVEVGHMEQWVEFYQRVFGFSVYQSFGADDISTRYSALISKVMANKSGSIKLPLNEPAPGTHRSQIQEYLDYYLAPGVQHIALGCSDIISTVTVLRKRGVEFLKIPRAYYDALFDRVGHIEEDIEELSSLGILVDRDSDGYLLQIFTKPVQDRPTLFFEVIQRKGSVGFGKGNFKALFESIEHEQSNRGNL